MLIIRLHHGLIILALLFVACTPANAQPIGSIISYQGKLTNPDGSALANGTYSVTFRIYENGVQKFNQGMPVATLGGVFSVFLSVGVLTFDPNMGYQVGVAFSGTETRHPIASLPVAQVAKSANTVPDGTITSAKLADGAVTATKIDSSAITLGYAETRADFSTSSVNAVQVPGLTATVTVPPGGRRVKITAFAPVLYHNLVGPYAALSIWEGAPGAGTQLGQIAPSFASLQQHMHGIIIIVTAPTPGIHTYSVGLRTIDTGSAGMDTANNAAAFLLIELI